MLEALAVSREDDVVEFAPGLGLTALEVLRSKPRSYTGVERDEAAAGRLARRLGQGRLIQASAESTGLPPLCATAVYGEAMLSMQTREQKHRIVQEAYRLLRPGGRYAIHELCATPEDLPEEVLAEMQRRMSVNIHVGVRLMTASGWRRLMEQCGFRVEFETRAPMHLLEPKRVLKDEGVTRTLRIIWNVLRDRQARHRVLQMRALFRDYSSHLQAIALVACKP
jgi:ubiquinone/menaquinone biosynthesis C-methylase UbiE